jgi:hypothetical protein
MNAARSKKHRKLNRKMKMEIPLDNVTKQIHENDMKIIKDQALEIHELQMVIVRLRDSLSMSDRDYLELAERHNK